MRVVLTGATGMIGSGVLDECLRNPKIEAVLAIGRRSVNLEHAKLTQLVVPDLFDLEAHGDALAGFDACFYCLGVSSAGMSEADYRRVTYDLTVAIVNALSRHNPELVVCYVSGQGTDSTGAGRWMWARVKGEVENWLFARDSPAFAFRPGLIEPLRGHRPGTFSLRLVVGALRLVLPLARAHFPGLATSAVLIGRAMIRAVHEEYPRRILEPRDINALAGSS